MLMLSSCCCCKVRSLMLCSKQLEVKSLNDYHNREKFFV
jgi:hypothetical protein